MRAKLALAYGCEERGEFLRSTTHLQFYTPVRQIPNPADHVEASRDLFDGVAKADALDVAAEENLLRSH